MSSLSDQGFSEPASKNKIHWTIHVFWTIRWYSTHHDIIISETRTHFSNIMVLGAKATWRHRELATAGKVEPQLCNRLRCWGRRRLLLLRKLQRSTKSASHECFIVSPNYSWNNSNPSLLLDYSELFNYLHCRGSVRSSCSVASSPTSERKQRTQKTDNRTQRHCGYNRHWTEVKNASALVFAIREHLLVCLYETCTSTHLLDTLVTGMRRGTGSGFGLVYNVAEAQKPGWQGGIAI